MIPYYLSMEALARAVDRVDGDIGAHGETLRRALAGVEFVGPTGPIRVDANRQAVVSVHLRRVLARGDAATTSPFRTIEQVDQSYGGIFTPRTPVPSISVAGIPLRCRDGNPPPWADS